MMRHRTLLLIASLVVSFAAGSAKAWSFKEHMLFTRIAVQRLLADEETPEAMKRWLREASPNHGDMASMETFLKDELVGPRPEGLEKLDYWVIFPDLYRNDDVEGLPGNEGLMHFVDIEIFNSELARQKYAHDGSNKPRIEDIPRDVNDERFLQAGLLPFRVEQVYGKLVESLRDDRLMPTDDGDRDNAMVWAGHLAHYVHDNTQPQHATLDYRSASYFPDAGREAPNVHGMMEYGILDEAQPATHPELREEYWKLYTQALTSLAQDSERATFGDPWQSTLRMSFKAYDALPLVGDAAVAAVAAGSLEEPDLRAFAHHTGPLLNGGEVEWSLIQVKAVLAAEATLRTEAALRQAWNEAYPAVD